MTWRSVLAVVGRGVVVVSTLFLAGLFGLASWLPLTLELPERVDNRLGLGASGLHLEPHSLAIVPAAADLIRQADPDDELVLRLRLRTASTTQKGPARIAVLATDLRNHDLLVGQVGSDLIVRRERTVAGRTVERQLRVPEVIRAGHWQEVEVRFDEGLRVTAGRDVHLDERLHGPQGRTARTARFSLGAETSGNHPWAGELAVAELRIGTQRLDLLDPDGLRRPDRVWVLPERLDETGTRTPADHFTTAGWHLLGSLLLGIGIVASIPRLQRPTAVLVVWAVAAAAVNIVKVVIASRHPSLATALLQIAGGWLGIVVALTFRRWWQRRV